MPAENVQICVDCQNDKSYKEADRAQDSCLWPCVYCRKGDKEEGAGQ